MSTASDRHTVSDRNAAPGEGPVAEPLAGFAVGVTAARRHEELAALLERRGARVVLAPAVRLAPLAGDAGLLAATRAFAAGSRAADPTPLRRLVGQAVAGTVDAITFTSAPAVAETLAVAAADGLDEPLLDALRDRVVAACVGPVTARVLTARGVPTVQPERARLGALVRALVTGLPARRSRWLSVRGCALELRGHAVVLDGLLRPIAPAPMAVLQALARRPGHVVSRAELCGVLPSRFAAAGEARPRADEHAVEMAVARLRRGLGRPGIVETVVKRGYRLACDPRLTAGPSTG
ncbi:uroporphyrinogen-III synthase [Actinomadura sp. 3N508]|uniref:uroporphyrinogen-III synthase n=1 Tax=Actinomadura sp. 3N508 TaxID=3375153 RepID=UPI0037966110